MRHQTDLSRRVSVPVKPGTLRTILRAAQLTVDELKTLL